MMSAGSERERITDRSKTTGHECDHVARAIGGTPVCQVAT